MIFMLVIICHEFIRTDNTCIKRGASVTVYANTIHSTLKIIVTDTTPTPLDMRRVIPIFLLIFVDMLGLTIILPLLHIYAATFGATPLQIGLVVASFPLAQLIGVPMMGALSDRFGRKPMLLISQLTTCLSFVILGLAGSLQMIVFSRLLDGLFGANISTAQAALSDITDKTNRTRGLGITGAAFGLGFIFGPIIAIITFELTNSLVIPALTAAIYSFVSMLITWFMFDETLPPEKRGQGNTIAISPILIVRYLSRPGLNVLFLLMFAQQIIFFGYESLLGLFTLSRLGFLGQGNALLFLIIGIILVMVQVRFIGKWSARYGEKRLVIGALVLLSLGLLLTGTTPDQPQPFYVRELVANELLSQAPSSTEAVIGDIGVTLPQNGNNGLGGVLWMLIAIVPISIGAGLIRPSINSLITQSVSEREYGQALGVSSSLVSAANACAPIIGGLIFQSYGMTAPFLIGGVLMGLLVIVGWIVLR
jgi:DHA1 family tetracycline resistance protein-like MFS transporter